jgi:DNA-binding winged helix-turn-helix (wHTH) protein/tetratricopeptide (TPR) repeat protein
MPYSFAIGSARVDLTDGTLSASDGMVTHLRPKTTEVLRYLLDQNGRLVSRDELMNTVWPGIHVTENGLSQCVTEIRRALGSDQVLLRTLPGRGYILDGATARERRPQSAGHHGHKALSAGTPVLAVLPFRHDASRPELIRANDILVDALVGALATSREPIVISANSTRHMTLESSSLDDLGQRLGATYVVTGTVRSVGERLSISLELSEVERGIVVFHREHDLPEQEIVREPARIAAQISNLIIPRLREAELRKARSSRIHDISAYHAMLEAQVIMARLERDQFERAHAMLLKAIELDPGFAPARAALAGWYSLRLGQYWSPDRDGDTRALVSEAQAAIELDGANARALALLGHTQTILLREYETAQDILDRAVGASPNEAEARLWVTPTLAFVGRSQEAIANAEHALSLSPEDPFLFRYEHFLSLAHYSAGNYDDAARWGLRSMRRNSTYLSNLVVTAAALGALRRPQEARTVVERFQKLKPSTAASMATRVPFVERASRQRYQQHLEAAGIPP